MRQSQAWVWLPRQWPVGRHLPVNETPVGDVCLIPGSGRGEMAALSSVPALERPMGRRAWRAPGYVGVQRV